MELEDLLQTLKMKAYSTLRELKCFFPKDSSRVNSYGAL